MATFHTIRVGRLTLREDFSVQESADRSMSLTGHESMGTRGQRTKVQVEQRRDDILSLIGQFVAIAFTDKPHLNGFYWITDASAEITRWDEEGLSMLGWTLSAQRVGVSDEIDIESRLSGAITRQNDFTAIGKRPHAPAVNHNVYSAGSTIPTFTSRTGTDGVVKVYQNLAQGINPRWGITVTDYEKGRVRFIDHNGLERTGVSYDTDPTNWELSNSLIRLKPIGVAGTFDLSVWQSGAWVSRTWDLLYSTGPALSMGFADYVTVLDNNYESVSVRLTKNLSPSGRMTVDLTLNRGSSIVEVYIQHQFGTTLALKRATVVAGTSTPGYVSQTTADGAGMKTIVGSARTFTADAPNHGISKAATATLDAFIGVCMSASAGDLPADVYTSYIGAPSELVQGVRK
jgi:hypothetical protein